MAGVQVLGNAPVLAASCMAAAITTMLPCRRKRMACLLLAAVMLIATLVPAVVVAALAAYLVAGDIMVVAVPPALEGPATNMIALVATTVEEDVRAEGHRWWLQRGRRPQALTCGHSSSPLSRVQSLGAGRQMRSLPHAAGDCGRRLPNLY